MVVNRSRARVSRKHESKKDWFCAGGGCRADEVDARVAGPYRRAVCLILGAIGF